jgi:hypothetical protein
MPLTSSPPIDLLAIQNEFGASSLSGAGSIYLGRANCNMLEFLGGSAIVYNFGNYSASAQADAPYGNNATAQVYFLNDGRVIEYAVSEGQYGSGTRNDTFYWATGSGINGGVEGYVVPKNDFNPWIWNKYSLCS